MSKKEIKYQLDPEKLIKTKSVSSFETTHTFFIYKESYENQILLFFFKNNMVII